MANRKRPIRVKFRVTEEEHSQIRKRMEQMHTNNQEAYVRKMAIDGYIVNLQIPGLKDLVVDLKIYSQHMNEIARRVNETDRIYPEDIAEMRRMVQGIAERQNRVLEEVNKLK